MNINYIGLILTTTSLIFETLHEDKKQCFYVKSDSNILTPDNLTFKDYVEDKVYTLNDNVEVLSINAKDSVLPSFIECSNYTDYAKLHAQEIVNNNTKFLTLFDEVRKLYSSNLTEEYIYNIKTQFK